MNRAQYLEQIMQDRQNAKNEVMQTVSKKDDELKGDMTLSHIATMLDGLADLITSNTQKVRILNHPKESLIKGKVSLEESDELMASFDDLEKSLCDSMCEMKDGIIEAVNSEKEVMVKNQVEIPEIEIPDKVKADILTMPKYVSEGFDKLYKAIKALELKVEVKPTDVTIPANDFTGLESRFNALETILKSILDKEVVEVGKPDFTPVESAIEGLNSILLDVRTNTGVQTSQTIKSSWDKSFDMKSKDMNTGFHYLSHSSGKKVVDYIEVTDSDNITYRRTFTFDADGDPITATMWTKQ